MYMHKLQIKHPVFTAGVLVWMTLAFMLLFCFHALAGEGSVYTNPETGYEVVIDDRVDLLTEEEETALAETMKPLTAYGNVGFVAADSYEIENGLVYSNAAEYAERWEQKLWGRKTSGSLLMIDMGRRRIQIHSDGAYYDVMTKANANTITDNVYSLASDGRYAEMAQKVYAQEYKLFQGQWIARPMKYLSNLILAVMLGLLLNFVALVLTRHKAHPEIGDAIAIGTAAAVLAEGARANAQLINSVRHYSPVSHGSSGGHSGGGGGGFSGGGHSGGGGGHSF